MTLGAMRGSGANCGLLEQTLLVKQSQYNQGTGNNQRSRKLPVATEEAARGRQNKERVMARSKIDCA